jgi:hypothetical protein
MTMEARYKAVYDKSDIVEIIYVGISHELEGDTL